MRPVSSVVRVTSLHVQHAELLCYYCIYTLLYGFVNKIKTHFDVTNQVQVQWEYSLFHIPLTVWQSNTIVYVCVLLRVCVGMWQVGVVPPTDTSTQTPAPRLHAPDMLFLFLLVTALWPNSHIPFILSNIFFQASTGCRVYEVKTCLILKRIFGKNEAVG